VDHAMSAYEWISAEEKLPNNGRDVLACLDLMRHWDTDGQSTVIAVMSYQPDTGRWYGDIDERGYTSFVTHWMDLPLPPVGEEA